MFSFDDIRDSIDDAIMEIITEYRDRYDIPRRADLNTLAENYDDIISDLAVAVRDTLNADFVEQMQKNSEQAQKGINKNPFGFTAKLIEGCELVSEIQSNDYNVFRGAVVEMVETASDFDNNSIIECDILNTNGLCHHNIMIVPSNNTILTDGELTSFYDLDDVVSGWAVTL